MIFSVVYHENKERKEMKKRWLKIAMVIILAGCSSNTNTNESIALNNLAKQFEEDANTALYDLLLDTVEANEYQICSNIEKFGTYIYPTGNVNEIDITPRNWDDGTFTAYTWLEKSIAFEYYEEPDEEADSDTFYIFTDDGSNTKGYMIDGRKDDNDPNQISIYMSKNIFDDNDSEAITNREIMRDNAKKRVYVNVLNNILAYIYDGEPIDPEMKATIQKNEEDENIILLEPKDMNDFNQLYMQGNENGTPLDVDGSDGNLRIDSLMYDLYQIALVLDKNNCISQMIMYDRQTAKYQDQTSSSEGKTIITISKMNQDDIDMDMIRSIYTKVDNGEIPEMDFYS